MPLPFAAPQRLWLAIHLTDPAVLRHVAVHCYRFTSLVSLEPPDGLVMELQGSLRLFGDAHALIARIDKELRAQGMAVHLAAASTPTAALWLSRACSSRSTLSALSVACLRWPQAQTRLLESLGVQTVADLMRLPRAGLARRLGAQWLAELDSALGRRPDPRSGYRPPERYTDAFEPEAPVVTTTLLEALLVRRLSRLQDFLRSRQAAIGTLELRLRHHGRAATRLRLALAAPCARVDPLCHLLSEQLGMLRLPAPVAAVRMRSGPLFAQAQSSGSLVREEAGPSSAGVEALPRLVERLRARLGAGALSGIRNVADHRPQRAWRAVDVLAPEQDISQPGAMAARPAWLCLLPRPLTPAARARLIFERGPERIESGWWDGEDVARDYFVARDGRGARLWVYREAGASGGWYLHGFFG